jgi:uncharacterized protein
LNELLVFAKAPRAGQVKTRLAQRLGAEQALNAYRTLLAQLGGNFDDLPNVTVWFSPVDGESELLPFFPSRWKFRAQVGADLGERLAGAFAASFATGAARVAVIGSDCPYASAEDVRQAWSALEENDVVFGPAEDGGYWLIAMKKTQPGLFVGIDWGTGTVLGQSLAKADQLSLRSLLLRRLPDVDTESDWLRFVASRESGLKR